MSKKAILVEGFNDVQLVTSLFNAYGIADVEALPPKELGAGSNGVSNVIKLLPTIIFKIKSRDLDKVAILIDADYSGKNGGFIDRKKEIETILHAEGYAEIMPTITGQFGTEYTNGSLVPIHVAILPDHSSDGMTEDLLLKCAPPGELAVLLNHAKTSVRMLPSTQFDSTLHTAKAELATYLAWTRKPGCSNDFAISKGFLDPNSSSLMPLKSWLTRIFS